MAVCYLDLDDEITDAVARMRSSSDRRAVLVLPPASRIASSRINFRLLAREAADRRLTLAIVSGEPSVRALALSAGLPAYGTVPEAETAVVEIEQEEAAFRASLDAPAGVAQADDDAEAAPAPAEDERSAAAPTVRRGEAPGPDGTVTDEPRLGRVRPVIRATAVGAERGTDDDLTAAGAAARGDAPLGAPTSHGDARPSIMGTGSVPAASPSATQVRAAGRRIETKPGSYAVQPRAATPAAGRTDALGVEDRYLSDLDETPRRARRLGIARRLGRLVRPLVLVGLVAAAVLAAYLYLPSATIVLRPTTERAGPLEFTATADPDVAVVDAPAGVVPAERIEVPVTASGEFRATGLRVIETEASGRVVFRSENTLFDVPIPAGTRVSTTSGAQYETTAAITVPRASFATGPTTRQVDVRAVAAGQEGNTAAGTITTVPEDLAAALITVQNPAPIQGGRRSERPVVTREDYDRAVAQLSESLPERAKAALQEPGIVPRGLTLFPDTVQLGTPRAEQTPEEVVDRRRRRFSLSVTAQASVVAVNESLLEEVAVARLREATPEGFELFGESVSVASSDPRVEGQRVVYTVTAAGEQYREPDADALVAELRGRNVSEAQAILARYGSAEINVWPEFIGTVPDHVARINLRIVPPERDL